MPYWRHHSSANGKGKPRFLTDSGSMEGHASTTRSIDRESGAKSFSVHTDASCISTYGRKNSHTAGLASVRSMWHRQIHFASDVPSGESRTKLRSANGCGS